jgi:pimeloyl-ACP methyl ester carboxylesterase
MMRLTRILGTSFILIFFVGGILSLAKMAGPNPFTWWGLLVSVPGAVLAILATGSLYEWIVHRFIYHRSSKIQLLQNIYQIHQHGHHWHRFPPDRYVQEGPVERIPVFPANAYALCGSPVRRWIAWGGQFSLYLAVGTPLAFIPAWFLTKNPLFTASAVTAGLIVCYLFIRVHDVMHYPANRAMERQAWFRFLDRHHYIHHIDTGVNLNFLLPLCDFLFGTLKLDPSKEEQGRWPSFEVAKRLRETDNRQKAVSRSRGGAILAVLVIVLVVGTVLIGGGLYMSNIIRDEGLRPREGVRPLDLEVVDLTGDRITLRVTPETERDEWSRPGIWGLRWEGGYAQVSEILKRDEQQVVREFFPMAGTPKPGERVRLDPWAFPDDPDKAFGLPTVQVSYLSPLGEFRAYFIDGSRSTWVIFVHGKRDRPPRKPPLAYPIIPTVAGLGLPSLNITYRNDLGEPASPDGFHWYGLTEWEDLEGAVQYAVEQGAEDLILVGYSMGGAIVTSFLYRSQLARNVLGVILDAPMLNFGAAVDLGIREMGLPMFLSGIGKFVARIHFGIDWKALNYLNRVDELAVPILLFHGDADTVVPVETSEALAEARPDIVTYHRVSAATHVRSWNMDPGKYETVVGEFLGGLIGE